jgi:ABC-type multidrug transport system ATPase subunit
MSVVLSEVALLQYGPAISLDLEAGKTLCVVGPAASGKSRLLRMIAGREAPDRGSISRPESVAIPPPCNRKVRPQDLSHRKGSNQAVLATEVLSQLRLWDARQVVISDLPESQVAACDLVEPLMANVDLLVLDEHLDSLDPWTRLGALRLIRDRSRSGAVCVCATNYLELASQFDYLVVLKEHQPLFAGSVGSLVSSRGQRSVAIESERSVGVRALLDPLLVTVSRTDSGYKLEPGPGQEHTAKMLREGYGDVRYVVTDERPLSEIILAMIS